MSGRGIVTLVRNVSSLSMKNQEVTVGSFTKQIAWGILFSIPIASFGAGYALYNGTPYLFSPCLKTCLWLASPFIKMHVGFDVARGSIKSGTLELENFRVKRTGNEKMDFDCKINKLKVVYLEDWKDWLHSKQKIKYESWLCVYGMLYYVFYFLWLFQPHLHFRSEIKVEQVSLDGMSGVVHLKHKGSQDLQLWLKLVTMKVHSIVLF